MLGVRLDDDLDKKLTRYIRKTGQNKSECAKQALREFLKEKAIEEDHDKRTLKGLEQIEKGEGVPLAKVLRLLDLWGSKDQF